MSYAAPSEFDMAFLAPYLKAKNDSSSKGRNGKVAKWFY